MPMTGRQSMRGKTLSLLTVFAASCAHGGGAEPAETTPSATSAAVSTVPVAAPAPKPIQTISYPVVLAADQTQPAPSAPAQPAASTKPNIVVIWGDDIGQSNVSAYTNGLMGYRTPNIDRIAREGLIFT